MQLAFYLNKNYRLPAFLVLLMYLNNRLNLATKCFLTVCLSALLTLMPPGKQQNQKQIWPSLAELKALPKQLTCVLLPKKYPNKHPTPKTTPETLH